MEKKTRFKIMKMKSKILKPTISNYFCTAIRFPAPAEIKRESGVNPELFPQL